jgi:polar amino acid transport system substrate-binding protein
MSLYSLSDAEPADTLQIRTISVPPYGFENAEKDKGIYYDLANTLINDLPLDKNITFNHQIYPYARIIHELKNGETDLAILFKYKELEQYVTYISPLPSLKNVVIGLNGSQFSSIQSLEGKTLAYLRGAKFSDYIDTNDKIIKITTKDFQQGIDLLSAHRVDAIIGPLDPIIAAAQISKKSEDYLGKPLVVSERTPWIQVSNKSPLMSSQKTLMHHFDQLLKQGELKKLRTKYLPHSRHLID